MPRVKVQVAWDETTHTFKARDAGSGVAIPTYSNLRYGDTPEARAGTADDAGVAVQTFKDTSLVDVQIGVDDLGKPIMAKAFKDTTPAKAAQLVGWADVPA